MTDWAVVWLGTMAVAIVVIAIVQILVLVALGRVATHAIRTLEDVRRDVPPLVAKVNRIADEAARATALAAAQVERVDDLLTSAATRVDETLETIQSSVIAPIRSGAAIFAGIRAVLGLWQKGPDRGRTDREEEDALFIG